MRALAVYVHQCRNKINLDHFYIKIRQKPLTAASSVRNVHVRVKPTALHPLCPSFMPFAPLPLSVPLWKVPKLKSRTA